MTDRNCIVKLEMVIDGNVTILPESSENPLRRGLPRASLKRAQEDGAWRLSDHNHAFLAEESRLRSCLEYDVDLVKGVREEMVCNSTWGTRLVFGEDAGEEEDDVEEGGDGIEEVAI